MLRSKGCKVGPLPGGRLFKRPLTLTASTTVKVLIPFSTVSKDQKASSILKVGFALAK